MSELFLIYLNKDGEVNDSFNVTDQCSAHIEKDIAIEVVKYSYFLDQQKEIDRLTKENEKLRQCLREVENENRKD